MHGTLHIDTPSEPLDFNVVHSRLPPLNEFASPGIYIQIIDDNGKVVVKSDNLGPQELPVDPSLIEKGLKGNIAIGSVAAGDSVRVRLMVSPLFLNNQTFLLEVAESLKFVDTTMSQVKWVVLAGIFISLVLSGLLGNLIVYQALSPVENITRTAREIEASSDMHRRVNYKGPSDEIGRLAATFDQMIGHLSQAFELQKQFVADASHELRTPLTVIRGNLDLLKRNLNKEDRQESIDAIESESKRMANIVNDLLLLAEIESDRKREFEPVKLKEIVTEEFKRANLLAGTRKIMIRTIEDLVIQGDASRLKQLLGNLVDNAIKYTPEGGVVTLSVFRDGEWARLEVTDTGIGIESENLPHLFERFYRVDKSRSRHSGGTGLGLAIVKSIAEQHGGKVTVASEPGKGSTFTVWLKL